MLEKKTVLITGATGLIGSHIVDTLIAMKDVKVIALSRNEEKLKQGFAEYIANPNFSIVAQDISDPICLPENAVVDAIFHAASPIAGNVISSQPLDVINPNLIGTKNCLDLLLHQREKTGVCGRILLFSSGTVYDNLTGENRSVTEQDTEITERLDVPTAAYSQAKRMSEVIAQAYCRQYGIDVVIARFSYVYGYTRFQPDTAFYEFIRCALLGQDIVLKHSGLPRRDNIYIDDAVDGIIHVYTKGVKGQVYNISSNGELGNFVAIDEMAAVMADVVNSKQKSPDDAEVQVLYEEEEAQRKPGIILDNTKLKKLGWILRTDIVHGIMETIEQANVQQTK